MSADAWVLADPTPCPECGRDSCEEHLPPDDAAGVARRSRLVRDIDVMSWTPPLMLVGDRIPTNALACLYGPSGLGKTFIGLGLGLSYAAGRSWLGAPPSEPGPVVYVATEGTAHVSARLRGWYVATGIDFTHSVGFYLFPEAVNLMNGIAVARFIADAVTANPNLIVIDTLARCIVGADENSAKDMGLAIEACDRIRKTTGATVLLVHHTGKDGGLERGSSALRGAADTVLALTDDGDSLKLSCEKQKDSAEFEPIRVRLVPVLDGATCVAMVSDGTAVALANLTAIRSVASRPSGASMPSTDLQPVRSGSKRCPRKRCPTGVSMTLSMRSSQRDSSNAMAKRGFNPDEKPRHVSTSCRVRQSDVT